MTEVDLYRPSPPAVRSVAVTERDVVDGWVEVVTKIAKLADMIADTDFVPKALRNKPAAISACMLTGREIGVGPMLSMKVIHMVQGTPSLAAEYKRARALERGHEIVYEETTITRCVVRGRRRGEDSWLTITWSIDDAKRAKLLGKDVWQQHPRRMLEARATGELCDLKFPDCTWGLPTTEILEDGLMVLEDGTAIGTADVRAIEPPQRTAQRRTRKAEPADRPSAAPSANGSEGATRDRQPPAPAQTAPSDERSMPAGQPPLPGEDDRPAFPEDETPDPTAGPRPDTASPPSAPAGDKTARLRGIVHQHFKRLGFTEAQRGDRLLTCERISGCGPLDSMSEMSADQLSVVADTLARCKSRGALSVLLSAGEKPDAGEPEDEAAGG